MHAQIVGGVERGRTADLARASATHAPTWRTPGSLGTPTTSCSGCQCWAEVNWLHGRLAATEVGSPPWGLGDAEPGSRSPGVHGSLSEAQVELTRAAPPMT